MGSSDALRRENEALRDRISRLHEAILRISGSLDLGTVLREVVESARALTGARYAVITTIDEQPADFVSSGFTPDERRQLADWPDGQRLFEHLQRIQEAVRWADFPAHVRSLGFSADPLPAKTAQGTPMRHRGDDVGHFFLGDKEGGQPFTSADEEILVLFASQAATAIANARTYRDEQRARADLETVIETSPVGVVVQDARTTKLVTFNQEARRIINTLRSPDQSREDLLRSLTCRFPDGREIALHGPHLARLLREATTVRARELVLSVPDGRSVRILVNVTPIRSADGAVEAVVTTMQDLTTLEELERLQADFLGMVSHELRAPLTSIKGSAAALLRASPELDPAEMREFHRIIDDQADHMLGLISDLLDAGRIETGTLSVAPEPTEVGSLVDGARNTFLSGGGRQAVRIDLPPGLPRVMADRRRIVQVLNNLLSNAARHSAETSPICVAAAPDGVHVAISVSDEGQGVPPDQLPHLFRKHAALAGGDRRRGAAGYGLGLAICKGLVEAHGGRIWAESGGAGEGNAVHVHDSGGGRVRRRRARPGRGPLRRARRRTRGGAHPGGRRRPADVALRAGRAHPGRLCSGRDRQPAAALRPRRDAPARPGPSGPRAPGNGRHRADAERAPTGRSAGHLRVRVRPGRNDRQGPGVRRRRLHRQALLADGADGAGAGRTAPAGGTRSASCWETWPSTTSNAG